MLELAPGVFVHLGQQLALDAPGHDDIANIGFIVGSKCVAVIDTGGSVRIGRALRSAVRLRTARPICYVINTHVHFDHVLGNAAFREEERRFLHDMPGVLGPRAMRALERVRAALGVEYGGIDFALAPDGAVLLFEANATMALVPPAPGEIWDYRRAAIETALQAARRMLESRAGIAGT